MTVDGEELLTSFQSGRRRGTNGYACRGVSFPRNIAKPVISGDGRVEWDDHAMSLGTIVADVQDELGEFGRGELSWESAPQRARQSAQRWI